MNGGCIASGISEGMPRTPSTWCCTVRLRVRFSMPRFLHGHSISCHKNHSLRQYGICRCSSCAQSWPRGLWGLRAPRNDDTNCGTHLPGGLWIMAISHFPQPRMKKTGFDFRQKLVVIRTNERIIHGSGTPWIARDRRIPWIYYRYYS